MVDDILLKILGWLDPDPDFDGMTWSPMGMVDPEKFDETQLELVRNYTRFLSQHNGFAICAHQNRVNYIVGESLAYEPVSANPLIPAPPEMISEAKLWIEAVKEVNNLPEMERETVLRLDRDGEAFIRVFDGKNGVPEARFVEPEHITSSGADTKPNELNGIIFKPGDWTEPIGYRLNTKDEQGVLDEKDIVHIKANVTSRGVRGIPTFYPALTELTETKSLLRGINKAAKARAKIALLIKVAGLTRTSAESIVSRLTQTGETEQQGPTQPAIPVERLPYGAAVRIGQNDDWSFPAAQLGANDYIEVIQAGLRYIGAIVLMPEWMFAMLADQKYSNAFVSEGPTLKAFQRFQGLVTQRFGSGRYGKQASLLWRMLKRSIAQGRVQSMGMWLTSLKFSCIGPSLEARDPANEAATNATYLEKKVLSKKTVRQSLNVDSDAEQKQIELEAKADAAIAPPVPVIPPIIPAASPPSTGSAA